MTVYDLDTNEPVTPSALQEAEHDLLAALSLRQHADTDLKREAAARIVARCRVEVHRLRALEAFDTGPADPPRVSSTSRRAAEREEKCAGTHEPGSPATRSAPGAAPDPGASGGASLSSDTGRATADFAPVELSRAAPGRAASPLGGGTISRVRLPAAQSGSPGAPEAASPASPTNRRDAA